VRTMLQRQYEQILRFDPGTRLGDDPEDLHQLRVAVRRLRSLLRAAGPLVANGWPQSIRAELAWLGGALGPVRDLDVLLERLRADANALEVDREAAGPVFAAFEEERRQALDALLDALVDRRYLELLSELESDARSRVSAGEDQLVAIAAREFRRLRRTMKSVTPESPDEQLHGARIRGKRARYAAELAEGVVGKPASRFLGRAKRFQDVLGDHQDAVIAEQRLRGLAGRELPPEALLAAGRLLELQRAHREAGRASLPKAWRKLERAGKKAFA
jgi:CHAD domain-containing protein